MTNLRLPSKRFRCFSVEKNKVEVVEVVPRSVWVKEKDIEYSNMSKEEQKFFDEIVLWKVIVDDKETYMPKEALKPFFEKSKGTEQR